MGVAGATAATGWALADTSSIPTNPENRGRPTPVCRLAPTGRESCHGGCDFAVRDLINTPAEDMGPSQLVPEARKLGKRFKADVKVITGDALLRQKFPTIHAVGRA